MAGAADRSANGELRMGLSRIHYPVTVLGYGTRVAVWFQGCSIRCRGCISQDTWPDAEPVDRVRVEDVLNRIAELDAVDGLTISGGEPFDQPEALRELIGGFRRLGWRDEVDVLVYSGYAASHLARVHSHEWRLADAVVTGPYLQNRSGDSMRGSANQEVHVHSDLGRARYGGDPAQRGGLQVVTAGGSVWMVGIPGDGDMARLQNELAHRGVWLGDVSWRC